MAADGATLAFNPRVGAVYTFEISTRISSEFSAFESRQPAAIAATGTVSVRVIGFRQGMFILDLWENENHTRRFLKPDGTVVGAPGEESTRLPFFWNLPTGDWQPGQTHRVQRNLQAGETSFPARWDLTLQDIDAKTGRARMGLAGQVVLPTDRMIQRSLTAKGTLLFDPASGCFDRGEWTMTYSLNHANKEIAVIRNLWKVEETRTVTFRLTGVTHD